MAASEIIMIRPMNFGYNAETAGSNSFQHVSSLPNSEVQKRALQEFEALARKVEDAGVGLKIFNDTALPHKPDAVFPNNWLSTHADGTVILYPMQTPSRRLERRADIVEWLQNHFCVSRLIDLTHFEKQEKFLEGTGSLVFDHDNKTVYASASPRTDVELVEIVAKELSYTPFMFTAKDRRGKQIYHTNVVMSIRETTAVLCLDCLTENAALLREKLLADKKQILELSLEQMESFAGNTLAVKNRKGETFWIMSERAHRSLTPIQIQYLESSGSIITSDLQTIESIGGGSARCMIAENFLQRKV
jgi:hypothetical protein